MTSPTATSKSLASPGRTRSSKRRRCWVVGSESHLRAATGGCRPLDAAAVRAVLHDRQGCLCRPRVFLHRLLLIHFENQFHRLGEILHAVFLGLVLAIRAGHFETGRPKSAFLRLTGVKDRRRMPDDSSVRSMRASGSGGRLPRRHGIAKFTIHRPTPRLVLAIVCVGETALQAS